MILIFHSERAQKITIDVAYRYFSYQDQKFIIADAPGHEQYTRNMAVAAANSDVVIILIDAKRGVKTQTIRHSYIASLFGIKNVIVAVNKMDLVAYNQEIFNEIKHDYLAKTRHLAFEKIEFVPISALSGENIVNNKGQMDWYDGKPIIKYLLEANITNIVNQQSRLQIQNIIKNAEKRYYQGLLSSGELKIGDKIISYPLRKEAEITQIIHSGVKKTQVTQGNSIAVVLDREIDLDRGGILADIEHKPIFGNAFRAKIIWFSEECFTQIDKKEYFLKINHQYIRSKIDNINHVVNINDTASENNDKTYSYDIAINQIADVNVVLTNNVAFDLFTNNHELGSFLLIDKDDNSTICAGIITNVSTHKKEISKKEQFINELTDLVKKYFGKEVDFSI